MSRFRKRHTAVGAQPGTLVIPKSSPSPQIRVMRYTPDQLEEQALAGPEEIETYLDREGICWFDVQGLGDEAVLREVADIFDLHRLALEDVVNVPLRPKIESFESHLLIVTRMMQAASATHLDPEQVSILVGDGWILTFQERYGDVLDPVRNRIRRGNKHIRSSGADYLAYAILDVIIDGYFPILEVSSRLLEELEDEVLHKARNPLKELYASRRELLTLRRAIWPQRETVGSLYRDDHDLIGDDVKTYFRDTYDHCLQLMDGIETCRELTGSLMEMYLSNLSYRQNEVMKVLTLMASIFIPLTFLAGIYGMNFENMPELSFRWSYPALLAVMVAITAVMVVYFRRRGWLGGEDQSSDRDDPT